MAQPALQVCTENGFRRPFGSAASERGTKRFLAALQPNSGSRSRQVSQMLRARNRRRHYFGATLFSDPAWDMLLVLYHMELEQRRISITALCNTSKVACTTGLRWIDALDAGRLIERQPDPLDGRRKYVRLSAHGLAAMEAYFSMEMPPK